MAEVFISVTRESPGSSLLARVTRVLNPPHLSREREDWPLSLEKMRSTGERLDAKQRSSLPIEISGGGRAGRKKPELT
jgi:hypothetical protein